MTATLYSAATASVTSALARAVTDEAERRELILASSAKAIAVSTQATTLNAAARAELVAAYSAESNERLMKELAAREGVADPAELDLSLLDDLSAGIDATVQETATASEREALLTAATEGAAAGTSAAAAEYEKIAELTPFQAYMLRLQSEEPAIRRHVMGIAGDLTAEHAASGKERARVRLEQALAAETDSLSPQERALVAQRIIQRSLEGAINEQTLSRRGILTYARGVADGLKLAIAARLARLPSGAQAELSGNLDLHLTSLSSFVSNIQGSTSTSEGTSASSPGGNETDASATGSGDSSAPTSGSNTGSSTESAPTTGGDAAGSGSGSATSPALSGVPAPATQDPRACAADTNRVLLMVASGLYACAERTAVQASFPAQLEAYIALKGSNQCVQSSASPVSFATLQAERDADGLYHLFNARCSP